MVESSMILLVLFKCGIEIHGIDRHHLMRRPMLADSRQVDERSDATPREPAEALDRFLVMVDAVAPSGLQPIDVGQSEVEEKQTTVRVVRLTMIRLRKRSALSASFPSEPEGQPKLPLHPA
jgi:hypothetical protein